MSDVFISYSTKDEELARNMKLALDALGIKTFLASISLSSGKKWKEEILRNLKDSQWVFFLATKESCQSNAVMHELGGSLVLEKEIVPLMWGIAPEDLPDWVQDRQAIDLQSPNDEKARELIERVAKKVKADRFIGTLVLGALGIAFIYSLVKK